MAAADKDLPDLAQGLAEAVEAASKAIEECLPEQEDLFVSMLRVSGAFI